MVIEDGIDVEGGVVVESAREQQGPVRCPMFSQAMINDSIMQDKDIAMQQSARGGISPDCDAVLVSQAGGVIVDVHITQDEGAVEIVAYKSKPIAAPTAFGQTVPIVPLQSQVMDTTNQPQTKPLLSTYWTPRQEGGVVIEMTEVVDA